MPDLNFPQGGGPGPGHPGWPGGHGHPQMMNQMQIPVSILLHIPGIVYIWIWQEKAETAETDANYLNIFKIFNFQEIYQSRSSNNKS